MMTREEFIKICTQAIYATRTDVSIENQISGYMRFHKETKENRYLTVCRNRMAADIHKNEYSLHYLHALTKYIGMGRCRELAEYLGFEILQKLKERKAEVVLRIVSSTIIDHAFLHIRIFLKGEQKTSLWEVDAWDPRIIDVSLRPDGTIKNDDLLEYGCDVKNEYITTTNEFTRQKAAFLFHFRKPIEGKPLRDATPERDIISKHPYIEKDYTLSKSNKRKLLPDPDEEYQIHHPQKKSRWQ